MTLIFPLKPLVEKQTSNNLVFSKPTLAENDKSLSKRSNIDRPIGIARVVSPVARMFAGGASDGGSFFRPREVVK